MSKTKKRIFLKRRKTRKTRKNITKKKIFRKSLKNRKMMGGAIGQCPVCLEEDKTLLKMEHALDAGHPTAEDESLVDHQMCQDCFMRLNPKNCPLCRRPVVKLIDMDDNRQAWPVPPRGPSNITDVMMVYLNQMPPLDSKGFKWNFYSWAKYINTPNNNNPFFQQFYDLLSDLPVEQLINMYKNSLPYNLLLTKDLVAKFVEYSKNNGQNINPLILKKNLQNIEIIKAYLSYILLVEVVVGQDLYFNRIADLFGW
jgi:hypothetical protein